MYSINQPHRDNRDDNLHDTLKNTKKKLSLYKALQLGYLRLDHDQQAYRLKKYGYRLDRDLSNNEHMVAYNPTLNKTLFVTNGSETNLVKSPYQFAKDWTHNILRIGTGSIKPSIRYKQENAAYQKAIDKYKAPVVLVGHSQGGSHVARLAKGNHQAYTLDPALINQKPRSNVHNYRTQGDLVSLGANDVTTMQNPNQSWLKVPVMQPHDIANFKTAPIFI